MKTNMKEENMKLNEKSKRIFKSKIEKTEINTNKKSNTKAKKRSLLVNLAALLLLICTFTAINNINSKSKVYAIEKPEYTDWIRDLYDYDETVTDAEILEAKIYEDEAGRVFYKNPEALAYEEYDGGTEIIGTLRGFFIGEKINLSDFDITCKKGACAIVYYNQYDFGNQGYASSTISASGCGPTSLAMVVDSLTNANIGVVNMCNWAAQNGYYVSGQGSKWALIAEGARSFGLKVNTISRYDVDSVVAALEASHPVIMICGPGVFTKGGHFIVLTGIDENGNVSVNDPASRANTSTTWPILTIMDNASTSGNSTFWEIYR